MVDTASDAEQQYSDKHPPSPGLTFQRRENDEKTSVAFDVQTTPKSHNARKRSTFRSRNEHLSKSARMVQLSSGHTGDILDPSESSDGESDISSNVSIPEEYWSPTFHDSSSNRRESLHSFSLSRMLRSITEAVQRSPPSSKRDTGISKETVFDNQSKTCEFPHTLSLSNMATLSSGRKSGRTDVGEKQPLLWQREGHKGLNITPTSYAPKRPFDPDNEAEKRAARIAVAFLQDYEISRACTLPDDLDSIKESQLFCRQVRYSTKWKLMLYIAAFGLFSTSIFEGNGDPTSKTLFLLLFYFSSLVFVLDMLMRHYYLNATAKSSDYSSGQTLNKKIYIHARQSNQRQWTIPLVLLLTVCTAEASLALFENRVFFSGAFKPIVLFYLSSHARDALEALSIVAPVVLQVILMELFIILSFAATATYMYFEYSPFKNLTESFVSLYECKLYYIYFYFLGI